MIPLIAIDDFLDPFLHVFIYQANLRGPPSESFQSFQWSPLLGSQLRLIPPFLLLKIKLTPPPPKSSVPPREINSINDDRSLKSEHWWREGGKMSSPSTSNLQVELLSRDNDVKYGCFTFFYSRCSTIAPMGPNTEFAHRLHSLLCMCCKSSSKRTQHCCPTTPNAVGCYMFRPFAHPVACCCAKFETGQTFSYVQTGTTATNIVGGCCVRLHVA